ncbi:putative diphthamide biosynthesis protein [Pseudovirgaria hyperparasitica]|uniref:2-(3-amino-3-carboxypropyl)histidine synthase subunit 1 n=1 Tax=Pseudovirgaria hyperparasitica TaxID=470096 RepID=A0A6A6WCU4_9PEZI|nr:putative diphthamide biosynthesis protein [Pseudovirgaria hyperparasitica]KAF2760523.1 putative diphthamide biosynthesis protein [Pseudovirgaria hyperparasitica]
MEDDREKSNLGPSVPEELNEDIPVQAKQPKKRFVGRRAAQKLEEQNAPNSNIEDSKAIQVSRPRRFARTLNNIPPDILQDTDINDAIALLPINYNFEIHKTIHRIRSNGSKKIALQFPEGLLLFATTISDILTRFCPDISTLIMGDVTYGACCIDDFTARALGCDLLVHYAHSCLIPVAVTKITTLYVFVSISIDTQHLLATIARNFTPGKTLALVGTIQFNTTIHAIAPQLRRDGFNILIPQITPLSKGEILGCTSPSMPVSTSISTSDANTPDILLYIGDGRFHLESAMIANPSLPSYRYDPYSRRLTREEYAHDELYSLRSTAIHTASSAQKWGIILGALGRQGNPHTLELIETHLRARGIPWVNILLSEIFPGKLALMPDVTAWVQIACPRLSIDWGYAFPRPLLSPYEALVALGVREAPWKENLDQGRPRNDDAAYPMDFYAREGLGRTTRETVMSAAAAG